MSSPKKWFLAVLMLIILSVGGYYVYDGTLRRPDVESDQTPPVQTATVRRGDLVVSATGAGVVIPAAEIGLSFPRAGLLAEMAVQVGDEVQAGDVLARQDDADARSQVIQDEIALKEAQLRLEQLIGDPDPAALAAARAGLAAAQADLARLLKPASEEAITAARQNLLGAQATLQTLLAGPSDEEAAAARADLELAEINLQKAQADYDKVAWRPDVGRTPQAQALQEATIAYEKAKANYALKTQGATAEQIAAARAQVAQAQNQLDELLEGPDPEEIAAAEARVEQARSQLDELLDGADPIEVELAQLAVERAQNNLDAARKQLDETRLTAPVDGVVTAVKAEAGEYVNANPIIILAEQSQPLLEVLLDETDLDKIAVGYEAEVTFDAFPDEVFHGRVVQVDPALVTSGGASAVRSLVQLDDYAKTIPLPIGLNATVDVIGGRAHNAVLVPVEALREIEPGKYAVFVMENGGPRLRMVEVGLQDFTTAEILSGLEPGEVVTTGVVKTQAGGAGQ